MSAASPLVPAGRCDAALVFSWQSPNFANTPHLLLWKRRTISATASPLSITARWWPLFVMPNWMQKMAKVTPHAWANDAFNRLMVFGASTGDIQPNLIALLAFTLILGAAAMTRVRVRA